MVRRMSILSSVASMPTVVFMPKKYKDVGRALIDAGWRGADCPVRFPPDIAAAPCHAAQVTVIERRC